MAEGNRLVNPVTGKQWDFNSLIEKLLEMQEALLQSQERQITLSAQLRDLERIARDNEDLKQEHDNQTALLADKTRENKYIHQELSRISSALSVKLMDYGRDEGDHRRPAAPAEVLPVGTRFACHHAHRR
jgi:hypothetical protein